MRGTVFLPQPDVAQTCARLAAAASVRRMALMYGVGAAATSPLPPSPSLSLESESSWGLMLARGVAGVGAEIATDGDTYWRPQNDSACTVCAAQTYAHETTLGPPLEPCWRIARTRYR